MEAEFSRGTGGGDLSTFVSKNEEVAGTDSTSCDSSLASSNKEGGRNERGREQHEWMTRGISSKIPQSPAAATTATAVASARYRPSETVFSMLELSYKICSYL
jgi:hypothetical protein